MMKYALIQSGAIAEIFETESDIASMSHPDLVWVEVSGADPAPEEGWTAEQKDGQWLLAEPVVTGPTLEQLKTAAIARRDFLLDDADEATAGMADAFIAELLDEADVAKFKAYAAYKLALNKVDTQKGYPEIIDWPFSPE